MRSLAPGGAPRSGRRPWPAGTVGCGSQAALALLLILGLLVSLAAPVRAAPAVVLLSLDGVRHDAPDRADFPALARMAREGARAEALVPVFPSSTFPNHVSLVTGTYPDRHGIVENRFLDPKLGLFDYGNDASFLLAEPLWVAAERQGVRAAAFYWVGSETDWHGVGATYRRVPFDSHVKEAAKVDQILAWLALPPPRRPGLIVSWWHGVDEVAHRHGPGSKEAIAQLRRQDRQLGRLFAGLDARGAWKDTTVLVVSDHGMVTVKQTTDVRALLEDAGIHARVFHGSALANIHLKHQADAQHALEVLHRAGLDAWRRDELPAELRYRSPRVGDIVAIAAPGRALLPAGRGLDLAFRRDQLTGGHVGVHGYPPSATDDVLGIFFALGRGVSPGTHLGRVRTVDVAATIAGLLGIEPPSSNEGKAIPLGGGAGAAPRAGSGG